jgi:DNA-binding XRE family transcriptional regulator
LHRPHIDPIAQLRSSTDEEGSCRAIKEGALRHAGRGESLAEERSITLMPKRFADLLEGLPKEQRDRAAARRDEILHVISLKQLRRALRLTQQELAGTLQVNQAAISKMESQYDMYISTLRRVLEAMGAKLKIIAEFPDGEIVISQFHQKSRGKAGA